MSGTLPTFHPLVSARSTSDLRTFKHPQRLRRTYSEANFTQYLIKTSRDYKPNLSHQSYTEYEQNNDYWYNRNYYGPGYWRSYNPQRLLFRDYMSNPTYRSAYVPQYRNLHSGRKYRPSYNDRVENAPYYGAYTKKIHRPFNPHWLFSYTPSYYNMLLYKYKHAY